MDATDGAWLSQRKKPRRPRKPRHHLVRGTRHNIVSVNVPDKHHKFLADLYTTLIDARWRVNIFIFVSAFTSAWLGFAVLYYALSAINGDMRTATPDRVTVSHSAATWLQRDNESQHNTTPHIFPELHMNITTVHHSNLTVPHSNKPPRKDNLSLNMKWSHNTAWSQNASLPHTPVDTVTCEEASTCICHVTSFTAAFLFSIETMTTIGYGYRYQTEACVGVWGVVMCQSVLGAAMQLALASVLVAKTRKARRRTGTILFSSCVCLHESHTGRHDNRTDLLNNRTGVHNNRRGLTLSVRVGEMRGSTVAGAHARGFLVKTFQQSDGSMVPVRMYPVTLTSDSGRDDVTLSWPCVLQHRVTDASPLWPLSRAQLLSGRYELVVCVFGTCVSTSTPFQARRSYNTQDMLWGRRFSDLRLTLTPQDDYELDISTFNCTEPSPTVVCSARDISQLRASHLHELVLTEKDSTPRRSFSVGGHGVPGIHPQTRRQSLGDLIVTSQGDCRTDSPVTAHTLYRHRKSVTDTYLGSEAEMKGMEEDEEDRREREVVLSIVSTLSQEQISDVRDAPKRRKTSVSQLFFTDDQEHNEQEHNTHADVADEQTRGSTVVATGGDRRPLKPYHQPQSCITDTHNIRETSIQTGSYRKLSGSQSPKKLVTESTDGGYTRRKKSNTQPYDNPVETYRRRKLSASQDRSGGDLVIHKSGDGRRRQSASDVCLEEEAMNTDRMSSQDTRYVYSNGGMFIEEQSKNWVTGLADNQLTEQEQNTTKRELKRLPIERNAKSDGGAIFNKKSPHENAKLFKQTLTAQDIVFSTHGSKIQTCESSNNINHTPTTSCPSSSEEIGKKQAPRRRQATVVQPNLTSLCVTSDAVNSMIMTPMPRDSLTLTSEVQQNEGISSETKLTAIDISQS